MRFNLAALILLAATTLAAASAQTPPPPAGSDWTRVQRLAPGTAVRIAWRPTRGNAPVFLPHPTRIDCAFISASDGDLACVRTDTIFFFPIHRQFHFQRDNVATVRLTRADISAVVGGAIGLGAGLGVAGSAIAASSETDHSEDVLAYGFVGTLGAIAGAGIGRTTDFMGGPTIYRAP